MGQAVLQILFIFGYFRITIECKGDPISGSMPTRGLEKGDLGLGSFHSYVFFGGSNYIKGT